jgi:hypothetical protein
VEQAFVLVAACPLSQPRSSWYQRLLRGTSVTEIRGCGRIPERRV